MTCEHVDVTSLIFFAALGTVAIVWISVLIAAFLVQGRAEEEEAPN